MSPGRDSRPVGGPAESISTTTIKAASAHLTGQLDNFTALADPHCSRCKRPITAPRSVAVGMGPRCRQVARDDFVSEVFAEVILSC